MSHPHLTPVQVPRAPADWHMSADQIAHVAQDPRLHNMSRDMLYIYFNPPKAAPQGGTNIFGYLQQALQKLGLPDNWLDQAAAWHPMNTIQHASDALGDVNARMNNQ